jgi:Na+-driven multidrug efflux pump
VLALIVYANRYTILSFFGEDYRGIDSASIIILVSIIIQGINYIFVLFRAMLQSMGEAEWILKMTCLINVIVSLCMIFFAKNLISLYVLLGMNYFAISVSSARRIKRSLHNEI